MEADVIGIGQLTPKLRELGCLDYDVEAYKDTLDFTLITGTFLGCRTSDMSAELAKALNMDPYAFGQHFITPQRKIDWDMLEGLCEWRENEVEAFKTALHSGWKLVFRPNY
jgi:hypothetical protein